MSFFAATNIAEEMVTQRVTHVFAKHFNLVYRVVPRQSSTPMSAWIQPMTQQERVCLNVPDISEAQKAKFANHYNFATHPYAFPKKNSMNPLSYL